MKQFIFPNNKHIHAYEFNGLKGRYGHWPAANNNAKRTFVVVYGQHASLERLVPIAEALQDYGDVYAVDNPGFGGMEPAYKIKRYPNLDFYAEHLEHFISTYIPADRKITAIGISYGFQLVTHLMARSEKVNERTEQVVSFVGFVRHSDLNITGAYRFFPPLAAFARSKAGSIVLGGVMRPAFLKFILFVSRPFNVKFKDLRKDQIREYVNDQIKLWMINDHRTHGATAIDFIRLNDLSELRIRQNVVHIGVPNDHLLNNKAVTNQLKKMYDLCSMYHLNLTNHAPLDIDTPDKVRLILPDEFKKVLRKSANKKAVTS